MAPIAWDQVEADFGAKGYAVVEKLLDPQACRSVTAL